MQLRQKLLNHFNTPSLTIAILLPLKLLGSLNKVRRDRAPWCQCRTGQAIIDDVLLIEQRQAVASLGNVTRSTSVENADVCY